MSSETMPQVEIFLRYIKATKEFEFRMVGNGKVMGESKFPESQIPAARSAMAPHMQELFDFLVKSAKDDPEEKFVSASNEPRKDGQATIG
jgi:hypothetical protein